MTSINVTDSNAMVLHEGKNWASLLCCIFVVFGSVGNGLVCASICLERRLHVLTNYFLFSLAITDLMVSVIVMPLSITDMVNNGKWVLEFPTCLIYVIGDVFLCSVSIVHMSVISMDRYWGLSHPFSTANRSKKIIAVKIACVWISTLLIVCPVLVLSLENHEFIYKEPTCQIFSPYYKTIGTFVLFILPSIVMTATFSRTVVLLRRQAALVQRSDGCGLRRSTTRNSKHRVPKPRDSIGNDGSQENKGENRSNSLKEVATNEGGSCNSIEASSEKETESPRRAKRNSNPIIKISRLLHPRKSKTRERNDNVASEQKATKVLGIVFACFFVCWTPFFMINIILSFCGSSCEDEFPSWLMLLALWLGYISSTINPVIYTIFNPIFRTAFVDILQFRCSRFRNTSASRLGSRVPPGVVVNATSTGDVRSSVRYTSCRDRRVTQPASRPPAAKHNSTCESTMNNLTTKDTGHSIVEDEITDLTGKHEISNDSTNLEFDPAPTQGEVAVTSQQIDRNLADVAVTFQL